MEETGPMRCDNCGGRLSVRIRYEEGKSIMTPCAYTTNYGGTLCGTGCSMSYINKHQSGKDVANPNSGLHVQR
jgi:hypothetical protein